MKPVVTIPVTGLVLLVAVAAAAGPAGPAVPDSTWTLDRCETAALAAAPALAAGRSRSEAARQREQAAATELYPALGLRGEGSYTTESMSFEVPGPTGQPHRVEFGDGSAVDLMLGVRAPLFRGGALRENRRAAAARWEASLQDVAADSLDLRWQVRRAFFGALGGEAAAQAAREGEARLRRHLQEVEANRAAGTATAEQRLQVLARLRRAEQTTVQVEADAAARRLALGRLVGRPGEQIRPTADLDGSLLQGSEDPRPWDERPELRALDARLAAADHEAQAARGTLWPAVDLEGGWHLGRPGVDPIANDWMDYGTVAVNLRWTLFDFGGRDHRVQSLRAEQRALAADRRDVREALQTRLATARTQLAAARAERDRAGERADLERRRLALVASRWQQGHATQSELLDAQDDVTLAGIDHALTQARLRLAESELLAALGW